MSSNSSKTPDFKPNQLVLCRYERYPYWPATITNNFPEEVVEGYRCRLTTSEGSFFFYWCLFCSEEKGGWVREDRILLFHPSLVRYAQVPPGHYWYQEQQKAFRAASKIFNALYSKALPPKPVDPISDLLEVHRRGGDLHETEDDPTPTPQTRKDEVKTETEPQNADTPAEVELSPKNESSIAESSDHRVTGKRTSFQHEASASDNHKPTQRQRVDNLLTKSAPTLLGKPDEGAEVTFFAPPPPEECEVSLPDRSSYHSRQASGASFSRMMKNLSQRVAAYNESSKDAEEAHHIFDVEKENIRRKYKDLFERLRQVERRAADDKKHLVTLLQDILQTKVDLSDLRRLRAGMEIRRLSKESRDVPAIESLCEEIVKAWQDLVESTFSKSHRENV